MIYKKRFVLTGVAHDFRRKKIIEISFILFEPGYPQVGKLPILDRRVVRRIRENITRPVL